MQTVNWDNVVTCGPPGVYRLTTGTCETCTEAAGGTWDKPETHVQRECVTQWLGIFYGTKHYFECLHTEDEGIMGTVTVEDWTILRAHADAVTDLYDAYTEADIAANRGQNTEVEEIAALEDWADMKDQVRERHRQNATYVESLRWVLNGATRA